MQRLSYPHILALVFWVTIYCWLAIDHWAALKHKPSHRTKSGWRSDLFLSAAVGLGLLGAFALKGALPDTRLYGAQVVFWLALLLAWSGIVLRQLAIRTLGKFFVLTVITQANQPVITTGPYRLIRHPSYLGALLTIIGVAVALNSLPGAVLLILLPCVAVFHRIKLEESYLSQHLGQPYRDYITHTKKLLPFVW